jgi:hypothetical protein
MTNIVRATTVRDIYCHFFLSTFFCFSSKRNFKRLEDNLFFRIIV